MQRERIDICAVSKTHLTQMYYLTSATLRPIARSSGGGVAILIKRGILHHLLALPGLQEIETGGIYP
jgi:hypothetical protein